MSAVQLKLDNLIVFMDYNKMQIDGTTDEIMSVENPAERFRAFGFNVYDIDGHDIDAIIASIDGAKQVKDKPTMIVLNTVKGKGVSFVLRRPLLSVERTEEGSFAVRLDCQTGPGSAAPTQEMLDRLGSVCSRLLTERWAAGQDLLGLGARQALALGPGAALDPAKNACPQLRTSVKVY